jgi:hypothetical protein
MISQGIWKLYHFLSYYLFKIILIMRGRTRLSRADTPSSDDRTVRLFVSSTFHDMQEERRILQSDVFPIVQRFLSDRGVTFVHVDLRWGVTREEAENGDVLEICLREIDRCRPWILGLLGARYGWIDPRARDTLATQPRFALLARYSDASVTELELRHAITNPPPELPSPKALLYWRVAPALDNPFTRLAGDIRGVGGAIRPAADDTQSFAECVRNDLVALIEAQIPDRPALSLPQFQARSRMEIGESSYLDRLEAAYL